MLKLFVWEGVLFDYTAGMMVALAEDVEQARALIKLMRRLPSKVNLIPFNPFPGTRYERSEDDVIRSFQKILLDANVLTMVRRTRGDDIDAACGQLKGQVMDRTRRQEAFRLKLEAAQSIGRRSAGQSLQTDQQSQSDQQGVTHAAA